MADKDKSASAQPKNIPKDGQVITSIMKEMGILEYEPKTLVQLNEFVYRYATSILEESRMYANNSKKKFLDVEDVRLAMQLTMESTFTTPPPREVVLACANAKNYSPLPLVKPHCGLRLPPDRHCLASCNYSLKTNAQRRAKSNFGIVGPSTGVKIATKPNISYVKRASMGVTKQTVTVPKALSKINPGPGLQQKNLLQHKATLKAKIQISPHNMQVGAASNGTSPMDIDGGAMKRKREDDSDA